MERLSEYQKAKLRLDLVPKRHRAEVERGLIDSFNHAIMMRNYGRRLSEDRQVHVAAFAFMNNFHFRLPEGDARERVERLLKNKSLDSKLLAKLEHERSVVFPAIDKALEETGFDLKKWLKTEVAAQAGSSGAKHVASRFELWPVFVAALAHVDSPAHLHT